MVTVNENNLTAVEAEKVVAVEATKALAVETDEGTVMGAEKVAVIEAARVTAIEVDKNESCHQKISEVDRLSLELAKANRKTAVAYAERSLAQNETAEIAYKYTVLQLYMRYRLTEADAINENGEIIRGGAVRDGS